MGKEPAPSFIFLFTCTTSLLYGAVERRDALVRARTTLTKEWWFDKKRSARTCIKRFVRPGPSWLTKEDDEEITLGPVVSLWSPILCLTLGGVRRGVGEVVRVGFCIFDGFVDFPDSIWTKSCVAVAKGFWFSIYIYVDLFISNSPRSRKANWTKTSGSGKGFLFLCLL